MPLAYQKATNLLNHTDTLRSIFDMYSDEYQRSNNESRILTLKKIVSAKIDLECVLKGYIEFYTLEKPQVVTNFMSSIVCFINKNLSTKIPLSPNHSFKYLANKLKEIVYLK